MYKKRFRWLFEGKDASGMVVWPAIFVKVSHRPDFFKMAVAYEHGGHIENLSGEIRITVRETKKAFEEYCEASICVASVSLKLLDGVGDVIEEWIFNDANMIINPLSESCDEVEVEGIVAFKSYDYKPSWKQKPQESNR
jgi:hypothetical protein